MRVIRKCAKNRQRRDEENKQLGMGLSLAGAGQERDVEMAQCLRLAATGRMWGMRHMGEVKNQVALKSQSLHSLLF